MKKEISEILLEIQETSAVHHKFVKFFEQLYAETDENEFVETFLGYFVKTFYTDHTVKNPYVERSVKFFISCIIRISSVDKSAENRFLVRVFEELLQLVESGPEKVRYNVCDFINKYVVETEGDFPEQLREKILDSLLLQICDAKVTVRLKVVETLQYFQVPDDPDDEVVDAFIQAICDPHAKVRAALVKYILPSVKVLPMLIERIRDVDENVRIVAFRRFSEFPFQVLTIEQRQKVLRIGIKDKSSKVQTCVHKNLIPTWLEFYDSDIIRFLKSVQLDSDEKEIRETEKITDLLLKSLLTNQPIRKILETLPLEEKIIPLNVLTWEFATYWKTVIFHVKSNNLDCYLDQILPETVRFCDYIEKFYTTTPLLLKSSWEEQHYHVIMKELIRIAADCDISDEASRICLQATFETILKKAKLNEASIKEIVIFFEKVIPNILQRISYFCEMISDIRTPIDSNFSQMEIDEIFHEKTRLKNELNQLKRQEEEAISAQDFLAAKQLQEKFENVEKQLEETVEKSEELTDIIPVKLNDPLTVEKCLNITMAMLQLPELTELNPALRSLFNELFQELAALTDTELQSKCMKCCGILCSLDRNLAETHIQLFCFPLLAYKSQSNGEQAIILASVACVVDIILSLGTSVLPETNPELEEEQLDNSTDFEILFGKKFATLQDVVEIFTLMLDDEEYEMREIACKALIKLLCTDRIRSGTLWSRLFLKWLNPVTAKDRSIEQLLGIFLQTFCQNAEAAPQIEEAFVPTLRTLCMAPETSPLVSVSKDNAIRVLVDIMSLCDEQGFTLEKNVVLLLGKEILTDASSQCNETFAKAFWKIQVPQDDEHFIDEYINLLDDIKAESQDKNVLKYIGKVINKLKK